MEHKTRHFKTSRRSIAGNALAMVFMAVGMAGVVTYGLNNIMRGPAVTAAEASRITIAENNLVATTRLAISAATNLQSNNGDCDGDGFVEPVPFRTAGVAPAPTGGGLIPMTIGASMTDPWGTQYGYCVWDPGTVSQSDNHPGCDNAGGTANRLEGAPRDDQPAIAVISAGKNGVFDTTCNAYVDVDNNNQPDVAMVDEAVGSDDIVLTYTYAEANGVGGGLWRLRESDPTIAEIDRGIRSTSRDGATFGGAVELTNRGLVLPGDPGDDSVTGPCDAAKNGQLRRNISGSPPTVEICDHTGGNGWVQISGSGTASSGFNPELGNCTRNQGGPLNVIDQLGGGQHTWQIWTGAGQSTQQLHVTSGGDGINALTFDGTSFAWQDDHGGGATGWTGIWSNGSNIFATGRYGGQRLIALTFDGSTYTQTAMLDLSGIDSERITGIDDVVFLPMYAGFEGLRSYRYTGGAFTLLDTFTTAPAEAPTADSDASDVWSDGTNIFYSSYSGPLRAAQWDGSQFVNEIVADQTHGALAVWGDSAFIYAVGYDGFRAYTYDGTNLTRVFQTDDGTDYHDIWGDGVYLYAATLTGIRVLYFDGADLTVVDENTTLGDGKSVWGDGNYIYLGTYTGEIYALGGYGCLDPNPDGGAAAAGPSTIQRQPPLPDPLDVGLVGHWTMDEPYGNTTVADSAGENDGERLDNATTIVGQDGGAGLNLAGPTSAGAVQIDGLLGEPQQGTIAGWVNLGSPTEVGGAPPDRAMIMSIGGYVNLYENYDTEASLSDSGLVLEVNSGGTPQRVRSNFQLTGAGWRYVVATFDTVDEMFRVYVDGNMVAQENQNWSITYSGGGTDTFIGRHGGGEANWGFNGSVDDFRVYSRALGPAEVAELSSRQMSLGAKAPPVLSPLRVAGKSGRFSIANQLACGIKDDGTLWCWGNDGDVGALGRGKFGGRAKVPVQVVEPDQFVYYLNNTDSDLSVGGSTFSKTMLPYMQGPQADLGTYTASQSRTGYGFTAPGLPGIEGASGNREYTVKMRPLTPEACLSGAATLARIDSAGVVQTTLALTPDGSNELSSEITLRGRGDLGTFDRTDRLRVQYDVNNTCGSALGWTQLVAQLHVPMKPQTPWVYVDNACAIKADGTAWCWGYGGEGALGNSSFTNANQSTPSPVVHNGVPWASLSGRADHTCGIKSDGSLWCWGNGWDGQLGNGIAGFQFEPYRVGTDNDWMSVKGAYTFTCGLKTNGTAWCWGADNRGQLGNGSTSANQTTPVLVPDPGPWVKLAVSQYSACGIKADTSMWCWGANDNYKLGTTNGDTDVPTKIWGYADGWVDVSQSSNYTCGIRKDGNVWCWGALDGGRGWHIPSHIPQQVMGISGATAIDLGSGGQGCVSKTDGALYCWGWNFFGMLGDGFYNADGGYPTAVLGFPGRPGWGWNDTESIITAPYNFNVGLNGSMIGDIGDNQRGFGFTSSGRARLYQNAAGVQLGLQAGAAGSSLLSFKTTPAMGAVDITFGLTGRWPLDGNANASVGGINGTNNGATFVTERRVGTNATLFDGTDDYVDVPRNAGVQEHPSFSVAFWVRRSGTSANSADIIIKYLEAATAYSYLFELFGDQINFGTHHVNSDFNAIQTTLPDETWVHVVGTFRQTGSGSNNKNLYINGELVGTSTINSSIRYDTSANSRLYFGGCPACTAYFRGALDDVRIYNRALSANEVAIMYGTQLAPWANNTFRMGVNAANNGFEVSTPTDTLMRMPTTGLTAIGTAAPTTRLDVQGGVRVGSETACDADREGALRYTGGTPAWSYCDGAGWVAWPRAVSMPWRDISAGWGRSCGIKADGTAWCWGEGQLGNNDDPTWQTLVPLRVHTDSSADTWTDWASISATLAGGCGLRANGTAWCWGEGGGWGFNEGRLGTGGIDAEYRPANVLTDSGGPGWGDWRMISAGSVYTCGIRVDGTAWCWGEGGLDPDNVGEGKLGNGTDAVSLLPSQVITDSGPGAWSDWVSIDTGYVHTCGIRIDGSAWCWGNNGDGQLGDGTNTYSNRPVRVQTDSGGTGWNDWKKVEAGAFGTCGLRTNGTLWCWGTRPGVGSFTNPTMVHTDAGNPAGWSDWVDVSVGLFFHACGIRSDGSAWCWGTTNHGVIGNGNMTEWDDELYPARVGTDTGDPAGWSDWKKISAGRSVTCGIRSDGSAWCWGQGGYDNGGGDAASPLGNGEGGTDRGFPVRVSDGP